MPRPSSTLPTIRTVQGSKRLHCDQPIPRPGCETVSRRHSASCERHSLWSWLSTRATCPAGRIGARPSTSFIVTRRQAPLMLTPNVFCVAADEEEFRYGTVLFHNASKEEIERHLDLWGRWLSLYPDHHGWWNEPDASNTDDPLEVPVKGLLRLKPAHVLDFLAALCSLRDQERHERRKRSPAISSSRRSMSLWIGQSRRS